MYRNVLLLPVLIELGACAEVLGMDEPGAAPTISITAPAPGSRVSRIITVSAKVEEGDGDAVTRVTFDLPSGSRIIDTAAPFSTDWDSASVADGTYTIQATATDEQGRTSVASSTVVVANRNCLNSTFWASIPAPIEIPDQGGIGSSILVAGNGAVASLSLSLSITHPVPADLLVKMQSPSGAFVYISDPENPRINVIRQVITAFSGQPAAGTWRLLVDDVAPADVGRLDGWSLTVVGVCDAAAW